MADLQTRPQDPGTWPDEPIFGRDDAEATIPGDYSIWVHMDRVRSSAMPWRLGDYGSRGVFSTAEIAELAQRHGFPRNVIRKLSRHIGFCLDMDTKLNLVEVRRSVAEARARERTKSAHKAAKGDGFSEAATLIAGLVDHFASETQQSPALAEAKRLGTAKTIGKKAYVEALKS